MQQMATQTAITTTTPTATQATTTCHKHNNDSNNNNTNTNTTHHQRKHTPANKTIESSMSNKTRAHTQYTTTMV